ncbi:MAG: trypsin-like peptidase domain-containing protein [Chloroflexi bacterium]|nr:trypsin-like peptidase domain-containing protein [Chloroflexota bacterium]
MEVLKNLSDALAAAVEYAGRGVVRVEGRRRLAASGTVWSNDGVIVTAHHVLERDENIAIGLPDGKSVNAKLIGRDATTDVAVLRAEAKDLAPLVFATTENIKVGNLVLALGRPGSSVQATLSIVSVLGDKWRTPMGGAVDKYLQTDVVMYPGFSGGPLINANGEVVGMNTSALARDLNVTLPTATLRRVVEALLAHGKVKRGYFGIASQPVRFPDAQKQKLGQEFGLLINSVEPNSPAEKGGLVLGDTIIAVNDQAIRHIDQLLGFLAGDRIGETLTLKVLRGGNVVAVKVVVGEHA